MIILIKIVLLCIPLVFPASGLYTTLTRSYSFESMAIGGLGAWFVFHTRKKVSETFLYKKYIQWTIYLLLLIYLLFNTDLSFPVWKWIFRTPVISELLVSFFFIYLIIGSSVAENSIINFENKVCTHLGKISYGIYMYHTTVISVVILFLKQFSSITSPLALNILFYLLTTTSVLLISHVSFIWFESFFINLKPSPYPEKKIKIHIKYG